MKIALKNLRTDRFLCAENGGDDQGILRADRMAIGAWETFTVHTSSDGTIALETANNRFVSAEQGGGSDLHANRTGIGPWERFSVIGALKDGQAIGLRTSNGQHLAHILTGHSSTDPLMAAFELEREWVVIVVDAGVPPAPTLSRLHRGDRWLLNEAGQRVGLRGISAFRLPEMLHSGRQADVEAFLTWCQANGLNYIRVFLTAWNMYKLHPSDGLAVLPAFLGLAAKYGVYVQVNCIADAFDQNGQPRYPGFDWSAFVGQAGQITSAFPFALVQGCNEAGQVWQRFTVQQLSAMAAGIPAHVMVSLSGADGPNDESLEFYSARSDFGTGHCDRGGADWRKVRHTKEQMNVSEKTKVYPTNDEGWRADQDPAADRQLGVALVCGVCQMGDVFHCEAGKHGLIPTGAELQAFTARHRGWQAIPADLDGVFRNVGWTAPLPLSCVESFQPVSDDSRAYACGSDTTQYVAAVHLSQQPKWRPGWTATKIDSDGLSAGYLVTR